MLQERVLVDILRNYTDLNRLRTTFDADPSNHDPLYGSHRKTWYLSGFRNWCLVCNYTRSHGKRLTDKSVTFASIYRATTIAASASDPDPTWGPIPATIWSVLEANAGIICACLPMLRSPFVQFFKPIFGRSWKGTTKPDRSYHLTWRGGKPHASAAISSRRGGVDETLMDPDHDSEEGIIANETGATQQRQRGKIIKPSRSPSGIFVRRDFSVNDNLSKTKSDSDRSTMGSVSGGKPQRKAPYSHT
jgi:hypothetical protein